MLKLIPRYPAQGERLEKGNRCRIVGSTSDKSLLYMVNSVSRTSILLVAPDGKTTTVLSFREYIDVVSADLSPDFELIHISERIAGENGFGFQSYIKHIHSSAKSKSIMCDVPMTAFFCPHISNRTYQLLHVVGDRISQIKARLSKQKIVIEKMRGGIHIAKAITWNYNQENSTLTAIHDLKRLVITTFHFRDTPSMPEQPTPLILQEGVILPPELALDPTSLCHLPYFRFKRTRIYVCRFRNEYAVIQQLYSPENPFCSFSVDIFPNQFHETVTINSVSYDTPICYSQHGPLIIVFIMNKFICFIDVSKDPPFIDVIEGDLIKSEVCERAAPIMNNLVDLSTGIVYSYQIDFSMSNNLTGGFDRRIWHTLTYACCSISITNHLVQFLLSVFERDDFALVVFIILSIFEYSSFIQTTSINPKQIDLKGDINECLEHIETSFPSSSNLSRKDVFFSIINQSTEPNDDLIMDVIYKLQYQNGLSMTIQEAFHVISKSSPPQFVYSLFFMIIRASKHNHFPRMPLIESYNYDESLNINNIAKILIQYENAEREKQSTSRRFSFSKLSPSESNTESLNSESLLFSIDDYTEHPLETESL